MPDQARRKEKHRLKRKARQRELRRLRAVPAWKLAARSHGPVEYWINADWREFRQASISVLRQLPDGSNVVAMFLVDLGVAGLKDAFGRLNVTREEFHEQFLNYQREQFTVVRTDFDQVRRLVAGGIRFAVENGFRLPHRYERWLAVLGDVGDWRQADTSDFEMEWAGSLEDLRRRLIGCSVDEFLARKDISFIIRDDDFSLLSDEEQQAAEMLDEMQQKAMDAVRRWCFETGRQPHPRLAEAWDLFMRSLPEPAEEDEEPSAQLLQQAEDNLARLLSLEEPESLADLLEALRQIGEYIASLPDPTAFLAQFDHSS